MPDFGYQVCVSGCNSIRKKKLKLYADEYPNVQLFFMSDPDSAYDLCILPAEKLAAFLDANKTFRLFLPPLIAFGEFPAMPQALSAGCIDYLCSPWEPVELFERVKRCIGQDRIDLGPLKLFCGKDRYLRFFEGERSVDKIKLSHSQYTLFILFNRNRGQFFSRQAIALLLDASRVEQSRAVDMLVSRLRTEINICLAGLGRSPAENPIVTASGRGWGINP